MKILRVTYQFNVNFNEYSKYSIYRNIWNIWSPLGPSLGVPKVKFDQHIDVIYQNSWFLLIYSKGIKKNKLARICIGPRALQEISDKFDQNIRVMLKFRIFLIYSEETEKNLKFSNRFSGPPRVFFGQIWRTYSSNISKFVFFSRLFRKTK